MANLQDLVYCQLIGSVGEIPVCGWVVAQIEADIVLATTPKSVAGLDQKLEVTVGEEKVGLVRIPASAASLSAPSSWSGPRPAEIPVLSIAQSAWRKSKETTLESSEASAPEAPIRTSKARRGLASDLAGLQSLFAQKGDEESEDDDDEESDEGLPFLKGPKSRYLPPGGSAAAKPKKEKKISAGGTGSVVKSLVQQGLAQGQNPSDLLPVMMMAMLMDKDKEKGGKKKQRKGKDDDSLDLLGGSDSDSSSEEELSKGKSSGMKAVASLHKMHRRVMEKPKKICEAFEQEVVEELGVVPGQSWTLRDYVKKQQWGKFKGIYRCAMMDVAVYELLRAKKPEAAAAQLVQNLKAKHQSVLQHGDWQAAWLLTGLPDPLTRKEWAGTKGEMSIISGYLSALHDLKKKVKDSSHSGAGDGEDEDAVAGPKK